MKRSERAYCYCQTGIFKEFLVEKYDQNVNSENTKNLLKKILKIESFSDLDDEKNRAHINKYADVMNAYFEWIQSS